MRRYGFWMICVGLIVVLAGCAVLDKEAQRNRFHIEDNALEKTRGSTPLRAVHVPDLMEPDTPIEATLLATNRIAHAGGNTVAVDLAGFSDEGSQLAPEAVERLDEIQFHLNWRSINTICRVTGPDFPDEPLARRRAADTAGMALRHRVDVLFWFEGNDAAELARVFRNRARRPIVAATSGAHVMAREVSTDDEHHVHRTEEDRPSILVGSLSEIPKDAHFIMPDREETYEQLDVAFAYPGELEPWEPDNTVLTQEERDEGWIALFDGKSLDGWVITGRNQNAFTVQDGEMVWVEGGGRWIGTRDRYENFVLRLEWRIEQGGNSGIFLRAPRTGRTSKVGMEFQLLGDYGDNPHRWGTGSIYDVVAPTVNASRPAMEWNDVEITLDGSRLVAILNDVEILNIDLDADPELRYRTRRGFIGLQDHGTFVAFRNIRLKPL